MSGEADLVVVKDEDEDPSSSRQGANLVPSASPSSSKLFGVTAVDTKQHERRIIGEKLAAIDKGNARPPGDQDKDAGLKAVEREIRTVYEIVQDIENLDQGDDSTNQLRIQLKERLKSLKKERKRLTALKQAQEERKGSKGSKKPSLTISFNDNSLDSALNSSSSRLLETERDKLIRTGVLTPFHKMNGFEKKQQRKTTALVDDKVNQALITAGEKALLRASGKIGAVTLEVEDLPSRKALRSERNKFNFKRKRIRRSGPGHMSKNNRGGPDSNGNFQGNAESMGMYGADTDSEEEYEGEELEDDVRFDGGYRLSCETWNKLFDYQQTGVKWLWELHSQGSGGILGDEMGLGKTVQVIFFLDGLLRSGLYSTSIIVCPVTLMSHWAREFRRWAPAFKTFVLHDSAYQLKPGERKQAAHHRVINSALRSSRGILITSYEQLRLKQEHLLNYQWGYAILDEGHKIRNPNIELTLVCKQLSTPHRIIMTGAPIQNRLVEIWSLFDFVFPGKLGTLPIFTSQFSIPIQMGGYAHASKLQITTAYKCALILRDLINPYLLRRKKVDVNINLPKKSEHVLFTLLVEEQLDLYRDYLDSHEVESIMDGKIDALAGIDVMKKVCNHPDLLDIQSASAGMAQYGDPERSGKLRVLMKVLEKWCSEDHKVLVFSQTRQMLNIIELAVKKLGYQHLRMDGTTAVQKRQDLVDKFNESEELKVFCLTTRVGGLGLNLTGADRVILYDPDWNPSTDLQAQERSWRIGQKNEVIVYRLITSGTIEEKIYNRQIFKQFLTNKVLEDPKQRRAFQNEDIRELFVLGDEYADGNSNHLKEITNLETQLMPDEIANNATDTTFGEGDAESNILKSLMEGESIAKALCHDKVMTANSSRAPSYDAKASEIAQKAAALIKKSQRDCAMHDVSVPTWTGHSGSAGAPGVRRFGNITSSASTKRFGGGSGSNASGVVAGIGSNAALTSQQLVEHLKDRNKDVNEYDNEESEASSLMKEVIEYFATRDDEVETTDIVRHFSSKAAGKSRLFKQILKQVAQFTGNNSWILRPEFRSMTSVV